ncbi:ribosome-binding factor A, partial [Mycobacterium sp. E3298]
MAKFRVGRVGEQIKKEISSLIQTELKDPRIGFITVTGVDVTGV